MKKQTAADKAILQIADMVEKGIIDSLEASDMCAGACMVLIHSGAPAIDCQKMQRVNLLYAADAAAKEITDRDCSVEFFGSVN